jgi:SAM-dependent methyltransferase
MTDAFQYYQSFSLAVGTNDWRTPNMRHELLRLLVDERLHGRKRLALLDVGCGAGVMAGHLRRYGYVSAIDFSRPAVELGRELLPDVRFLVGTVDDLAEGEIFDVITLFDVFEHIRLEDRAPLFAQLDTRLAAAGQLFLSTPHPKLTAWLSTEARGLMQAIEETVELSDVLELARQHDLELAAYETYDIERSGPQYQFIALRRTVVAGRRIAWPNTRYARALHLKGNRPLVARRRLRVAVSCALRARWRTAAWLLSGRRRDSESHE